MVYGNFHQHRPRDSTKSLNVAFKHNDFGEQFGEYNRSSTGHSLKMLFCRSKSKEQNQLSRFIFQIQYIEIISVKIKKKKCKSDANV